MTLEIVLLWALFTIGVALGVIANIRVGALEERHSSRYNDLYYKINNLGLKIGYTWSSKQEKEWRWKPTFGWHKIKKKYREKEK